MIEHLEWKSHAHFLVQFEPEMSHKIPEINPARCHPLTFWTRFIVVRDPRAAGAYPMSRRTHNHTLTCTPTALFTVSTACSGLWEETRENPSMNRRTSKLTPTEPGWDLNLWGRSANHYTTVYPGLKIPKEMNKGVELQSTIVVKFGWFSSQQMEIILIW